MLSKINVSVIFNDHLETLRDNNSNKPRWMDYTLFYGIPILISGILMYFSNMLTKEVSNILITCFSIFAALLLNLLMIIFDLIKKVNDKINDDKDRQGNKSDISKNRFDLEIVRKNFLKEIYSNISYAILICIIGIIFLLTFYFVSNTDTIQLLSSFTYVIVINFLITLLMIIKRVHLLLSGEIDKKTSKKKKEESV